uniref:Uncharacterized protein n=2 Tax=Asterionellopsis glacialis TaxID=33640 RepID=A0A7S0L147_9STRA
MWEKLRPNGVMVIVEPGTPDGFNTIRSIRDMLLDCCPPSSLQNKESDDLDDDPSSEEEDYFDDCQDPPSNKPVATEECHVIAPCTHNGTCPMERHIPDFKKKGDTALSSKDEEEEGDDNNEEDNLDDDDDDDDDEEDDDFDWDSYEDDDDEEGQQKNHTNENSTPKSDGSGMDKTHAFDTAFCSFVHTFPGGTTRKSGEKFSYLVVQKRVPTLSPSTTATGGEVNGTTTTTTELQNVYNFANVSDLLAETCIAGKAVKKVQRKKAERFVRDGVQHDKLLQDAETLKDEYYALEEDKLGLELLHGDGNRQGFGRIVRAPLKRRGHILVDYCGQSLNGREGRIVRHRVSKGWSKRVAPGMFGAARKARWGGYWPDIKRKITEDDNDDASSPQNEFEIKAAGEEWSTSDTKGGQ